MPDTFKFATHYLTAAPPTARSGAGSAPPTAPPPPPSRTLYFSCCSATIAVPPPIVAKLEDPDESVRIAALETLGKLEPAALAPHTDAIVAKLVDSDKGVRCAALGALRKLGAAVLAPHAAAIVAKLEDSEEQVYHAAWRTLGPYLRHGKLEPAVLAGHASAIVATHHPHAFKAWAFLDESAGQALGTFFEQVAEDRDDTWEIFHVGAATAAAALAPHEAAVLRRMLEQALASLNSHGR